RVMLLLTVVLVAASPCFSLYVGTLYFPKDRVDVGGGNEIYTFFVEEPMTMFDYLFGTTSYFDKLKDEGNLRRLYKETLIDIAMLGTLDPSISLISECYEEIDRIGGVYGDASEAMDWLITIYSAIVNNRYVPGSDEMGTFLNYLKRFGRVDTNITSQWNAVSKGIGIAGEIVKWSKYPLLINSVSAHMLSMDFALGRLKTLQREIAQNTDSLEVSPLFEEALCEAIEDLEAWSNEGNMRRFATAYFDQIDEIDLAADVAGTAISVIKGAMSSAGVSAIPILGWGFAIKFSIETILSGINAQEIFGRHLISGDILHHLRELRWSSEVGSGEYIEIALMELYSQMYAAELGKDFFGEKVQKFVVWKSREQKEVIKDFDNDIEVVRGYIKELVKSDEILSELERIYGETGNAAIPDSSQIIPAKSTREIKLAYGNVTYGIEYTWPISWMAIGGFTLQDDKWVEFGIPGGTEARLEFVPEDHGWKYALLVVATYYTREMYIITEVSDPDYTYRVQWESSAGLPPMSFNARLFRVSSNPSEVEINLCLEEFENPDF
ncbi:MAG: hypothetical protein WCR75_11690, partial [Sphaerochaetaceae bacterium]